MLIFKAVPCNLNNSFQKWLIKVGSLSLTIDIGTPCNRIISLTKISAIDLADYGCLITIKCPYLLNLSTTTSIASNPVDFGKPTIKSMLISSQIALGIGKGCSKPAREDAWYLLLWYTWHATTNSDFSLHSYPIKRLSDSSISSVYTRLPSHRITMKFL